MRINLFEGVSDEDIQRSLNLIHSNLRTIAYHQSNSHTFKKHSDKTDAYLKMRIYIIRSLVHLIILLKMPKGVV